MAEEQEYLLRYSAYDHYTQPISVINITYNLGHKAWKNSFYTHAFCPFPLLCNAMLTKHFYLTKIYVLLFSDIVRGTWGC